MSRALTRVLLPLALMLLTSLALATPIAAQEQTGSVTVFKYEDVNENGIADEGEPALAGACFELWDPNDQGAEEPAYPEQCTDTTGETVFEEVEQGDYMLVETVAPEGYEFAEPMFVTVGGGEGEDTEENLNPAVDVANYPAQEPMGLLEVNKLDCEGADEPTLTLYNNPDPFQGDPQAPEDVHPCALGNATFEVTGGDLAAPLVLETNTFGWTITELPEGNYQLREIDPNEVGPVAFAITCDPEQGGCNFVLAVAINPDECGCPTPTPAIVPAAATRAPAAPLPNTAEETPQSVLAVAMLVVLGAGITGVTVLNVADRRRS